ncbi:hypothetical protein PCANC_02545 [Puccinia coronata f. sp. avenae]|uniref:Protein phosphatase n=1 Tax=Puccinia coronata f. sp. avenae TaxID=200324 RepID=A0A2N5VYE8_9BASI|nr:hypothetical protein PCASD_17692 [Puccinia coronata f. sp. avenae]PLW55019.1 hypothetical protein PCANC_02545 [Puccinia coronata f. sp. avenae]
MGLPSQILARATHTGSLTTTRNTSYLLTSPTSCFHSNHRGLSPRTSYGQATARFQSTRPNAAICKFINVVSFIGKSVSEEELLQSAHRRRQRPTGFGKWVEKEKMQWAEINFKSHPGNHPPPQYERLTNSGHDWWFINHSNRHPANSTYLGVADGVGGWAEDGNDPAEVSQGIMFHADQLLKNQSIQQQNESPASLLSRAFQKTLKDDQVGGGASTALIAQLDPTTATLHWANLGDSSMIHIKSGAHQVGTRTKAQTHYFNCPYQLTKFPAGYPTQNFVTDTPEMADSGKVALKDGDLVLLFTDGVGDNLWTEEILTLIRAELKKKPTWDDHILTEEIRSLLALVDEPTMDDYSFINNLAHKICWSARQASFQENRSTPIEAEAVKNGITDLKGGKPDDITLVLSLVRFL